MKTFLAVLILSNPLNALADFIFSPGVDVTGPLKSYEEADNGKKTLDSNAGFGFVLNLDWIVFKPLTLGIGVGYHGSSGKTQFKNNFSSAYDLDTTLINLNIDAGAKLRIINLKKIKMFIGGGLTTGILGMTFDKDKFEDITGSTTGFEESESQSYSGMFVDAGFEYILSNKSGLRLTYRRVEIETQEFENLDKSSLNIDHYSIALQYMHYVNWDFFWK